uniref:Uncharacterized protein n=1 Tax=Meloidogyne floridensis TaxID=298350 RepID=A0A915NKC9_9BILA
MLFLSCFTDVAAQLLFASMPFILVFSTVFVFCAKKKDQKESKEPKPEPPPPKFLKDWPTEKVRANEVGYGTLSAIKPDQLFPQQGAASKNNVSSNNKMAIMCDSL